MADKSDENKTGEPSADQIKLKACPFCTSTALATLDTITGFKAGDIVLKAHWVYCAECGCSGPHADSLREGCHRWNVRAAKGLAR